MLQPWYVRSLPLRGQTGSDLFQALYGHLIHAYAKNNHQTETTRLPWHTVCTLLESPYPLPQGVPQASTTRYSLCAGPPRLQGPFPRVWTPNIGEVLSMLRARLTTPQPPAVLLDEAGRPWPEPVEPFAGGWLGWLGYDLAWEIEALPKLNPDPLPFPVAFWYEPATFAILDHLQQRLWLAATLPQDLDAMQTAVETPPISPPAGPETAGNFSLGMSRGAYEAAVRRAQEHIQAGDIFQANLSLRFSVETAAASWAIYRRLQQINPSPFASYWQTPWGAVVSCSPERLVSLQGTRAEARPIAGTRSRGQTLSQDRALAETLQNNRKEQAEHIMLVDLIRNDLGRVSTWGTVQVDELMVVEPYSHVMHLVSNVSGQLASDFGAVDLIRAAFPGGTITGCPKVRCMEIIEALEPVSRSLFYGSCGYLDVRGNLDLNILIRTLLWVPQISTPHSTVWGQVGAGIVADSQPALEWLEALQKAKAQLIATGINLDGPADALPTPKNVTRL